MLPPEAGGHARVRIFNPRHEMPFAGHPVLGTAFVLGVPLQLGAIALETGAGVIELDARARRVGAARLRAHGATGSGGAIRDRHRCALRRSRHRALGAARRAVRQRRDAHRRHAREHGRGRSARSTGHEGDRGVRRHRRELRRRRRQALEVPGVLARAARMRRRARPRVRSRCTSAPTGSRSGATGSRSPRAPRWAGPRRSTPVAEAAGGEVTRVARRRQRGRRRARRVQVLRSSRRRRGMRRPSWWPS